MSLTSQVFIKVRFSKESFGKANQPSLYDEDAVLGLVKVGYFSVLGDKPLCSLFCSQNFVDSSRMLRWLCLCQLCALGQVIEPLWASIPSLVRRGL